jgi:hypothetical protein
VYVIDMDWHVTSTGNESPGWTGYTVNRDLIPDPAGLFRALHDRGMAVTLNLHPADGVWPHEEQYTEMARRMGVSPPSPVPFNCSDLAFMRHYFEVLHHPYESIGVDFWWIDWQQGTGDLVDPLAVLNHHHFADAGRDGHGRPLILSRWCGLGGQRYPIGFSGDTTVDWSSLQFQPYFTATAANVGFGFWSHDIGGHFAGIETGELYLRWLQFGAMLPILRMHSNRNPFHERMPWRFDPDIEEYGVAALKLHAELLPLFYSLAYRNHTEGIQPVRPMYYLAPQAEDSYNCPAQFALGDDIIVAPLIVPLGEVSQLANTAVWLPAGLWFDFQSGRQYSGGWHFIAGDLPRIPIFVRAGGIVPNEVDRVLTLHVFPLGSREFSVYEDDGVSTDGPAQVTKVATTWEEGSLKVVLSGEGANRRIVVKMHCVSGDANMKLVNADLVKRTVGGNCLALEIQVGAWPVVCQVSRKNALVVGGSELSDVELFDILKKARLNTWIKRECYRAVQGAEVGSRAKELAELVSLPIEEKWALWGECCGFGLWHFTKQMGKNVVVVWNTREDKEFTFVYTCYDQESRPQRVKNAGVVGKSMIFDVEERREKRSPHCHDRVTKKVKLELKVAGLPAAIIDFGSI